eukprot:COSAG03_NODE_503_length_7396_cov_5.279704_3_plen_54_part_00
MLLTEMFDGDIDPVEFEVLRLYRHLRANFTYDVIPIALFQAPIYVTSATEVLM